MKSFLICIRGRYYTGYYEDSWSKRDRNNYKLGFIEGVIACLETA